MHSFFLFPFQQYNYSVNSTKSQMFNFKIYYLTSLFPSLYTKFLRAEVPAYFPSLFQVPAYAAFPAYSGILYNACAARSMRLVKYLTNLG